MANNTNLPAGVATGYTVDGITTVIWGTDGVLQSPSPSAGYAGTGYYVVISCDEAEDSENIPIENGTGIKAARVLLVHGHNWNITVLDDTTMTAPTVGSTVTILNLFDQGKAGTFIATVVNNNYRAARKTEGQRVLQVENLTLVDPQ